jgi:hypothetical protein
MKRIRGVGRQVRPVAGDHMAPCISDSRPPRSAKVGLVKANGNSVTKLNPHNFPAESCKLWSDIMISPFCTLCSKNT